MRQAGGQHHKATCRHGWRLKQEWVPTMVATRLVSLS